MDSSSLGPWPGSFGVAIVVEFCCFPPRRSIYIGARTYFLSPAFPDPSTRETTQAHHEPFFAAALRATARDWMVGGQGPSFCPVQLCIFLSFQPVSGPQCYIIIPLALFVPRPHRTNKNDQALASCMPLRKVSCDSVERMDTHICIYSSLLLPPSELLSIINICAKTSRLISIRAFDLSTLPYVAESEP